MRWLGTARMLPFSVCRAEERIITGTSPSCAISRRASARLSALQEALQFIDGASLPLVSDGISRVAVWLFAGGLVSASVAHELEGNGMRVADWNDVSVVVRTNDLEKIGRALMGLNAATAHPAVPNDLSAALKFSLCLPQQLVETVIYTRTGRPEELAASLSRNQRRVIGVQRAVEQP